jgi:RNA polymerase sigma-B factor
METTQQSTQLCASFFSEAPQRSEWSMSSTAYARQDEAASTLIAEFATLPADDPRRRRVRDQAIEAWLPLAQHLARRYSGRGEPFDDLLQVAVVGLIKSVDRFEPSRGVEFAGFAIPTILGELKRHFRDRTWSVRVPRRLQEMRMRITSANNDLTQTLNRAPTVAEIAAHLGVTEEEIIEGLEGARAYQTDSLSAPTGDEGSPELGETLGGEDDGYELTEMRLALEPAMAALPRREQQILSLRFYGNLTQTQIAAKLGISQMHVSRLIAQSLATLRETITDGD